MFELVSCAVVEDYCAGGLVTEMFDDSDKVGADDVLLHGCPQSCVPNLVEGLVEVNEVMIKVLWVLEMFFTKDSMGGIRSQCES